MKVNVRLAHGVCRGHGAPGSNASHDEIVEEQGATVTSVFGDLLASGISAKHMEAQPEIASR